MKELLLAILIACSLGLGGCTEDQESTGNKQLDDALGIKTEEKIKEPKKDKKEKKEEKKTEKEKSESKTKTETKKEYAYKGDVLKLNQKDYDSWKERFNLLDFDYELEKRDIWLSGQENTKNWFLSTKQYFLGLQREKEKAKEEEKRLMTSWWRE